MRLTPNHENGYRARISRIFIVKVRLETPTGKSEQPMQVGLESKVCNPTYTINNYREIGRLCACRITG